MLPTDVHIPRERVLGQGVIQKHDSLRPDHGVQKGLGQVRRCRYLLSQRDLDRLPVGYSLRFDLRRVATKQNEQAALGAGMLERERHQGFDQALQNDLTGDGLRGRDHRADIELLDRGADGGSRQRRSRCLGEPWVLLVELAYLAQSAPAQIAMSRVPQIGVSDTVDTTRRVEARGYLMGQTYLWNARHCYLRWGALGKVR